MNSTKMVGFSTLAAVLSLFSAHALANREVSFDYGTVIESIPIVKNIRVSTPREECWDEDVVYRDYAGDDGMATVIGAIVGGAIGNAVGHSKKNKQVGVVVGAVLGGTIGHSISRNSHVSSSYTDTQEVCRVYNDYRDEERIVGYRIRYRYNNQTYTTRTDVAPGDTIKLRVTVSPVN